VSSSGQVQRLRSLLVRLSARLPWPTLAQRALWVVPVVLVLGALPVVGSAHGTLRSAEASPTPACSTGARTSSPADRSALGEPNAASRAPRHPAPPPGSAAYRCIRAAWDAGDDAEVLPAGTRWGSVRVGNATRRYIVSIPPSRQGPAPLVVAFHGLGGRAAPFATRFGLVTATRAAGQVLVLPESSGPAFNDGRLGAAGPDDDAFAMAVIRRLVAGRVADPRRITVAGFSNGAGMAMEVAGRHPRVVASVVSIDGALMAGPKAPRPTGPVRAWLVHGTTDRVQPWNGRTSVGPTWPAYISQPATVAQWVTAAAAGHETTSTMRGGPKRSLVTVHTWTSATGPAVTFYAVTGMGHVWPTAAVHTIGATSLVVRAAATALLPAPRTATGG
jgi:polyhydroxybutyrate depolymerase